MSTASDLMDDPIADPIADPMIDAGRYVRADDDGASSLHLMVGGIHCAGCVRKIETALADIPDLIEGRVNFTTHRLHLRWRDASFDPARALARVSDLGFRAQPYDPALLGAERDAADKALMRAMAVAGFAAANVMLLSVSIWAGWFSADMGPATRALLHWFSALIALPAIAYAGRPFYVSAWQALRGRRLNMDVPISLAVLLAGGMSLYETITFGDHAYFDAAVTLLFFLLIGRYLDRRARSKAEFQAEHLLALASTAAMVLDADGSLKAVPVEDVRPGQKVMVAVGERLPVDGVVIDGNSDVDMGLVTGESVPVSAAPGAQLFAGTMNLTGALIVEVSAAGEDTLLSEIVRLMESAAQARGRYVRLADRAAAIYAPTVHILGLATFLGWWLIGGAPWQGALMTGIAVLIITCPCALGLAVPAVQIVATGRLLRQGILVKAPDALERLAEIDHIVFDKTGTLSVGTPELTNAADIAPEHLELASTLAASSRHPLARAIHVACPDAAAQASVSEAPGQGLEAEIDGANVRLGSRLWCGVPDDAGAVADGPELWLSGTGAPLQFQFRDRLRDDAARTVAKLARSGYDLHLVSGDREAAVRTAATEAGIEDFYALTRPDQKARLIGDLGGDEARVLMVGDGINDAPALASAHASISPASAAEISQAAADVVFQGDHLAPVAETLAVARKSRRVALQNFAIALTYNMIAVPLAMAGLVTPLIAAAAMSTSSILVISNALRLRN